METQLLTPLELKKKKSQTGSVWCTGLAKTLSTGKIDVLTVMKTVLTILRLHCNLETCHLVGKKKQQHHFVLSGH